MNFGQMTARRGTHLLVQRENSIVVQDKSIHELKIVSENIEMLKRQYGCGNHPKVFAGLRLDKLYRGISIATNLQKHLQLSPPFCFLIS